MTPEEETALNKSVTDLKNQVDQLSDKVTTLLAVGPPDLAQNCRTRYQENGSWARHYSTVRMTVATFLVPVSIGILAFNWKPPLHPPISFVALSGVLWSIAVVLFLTFTRLTYGEMEKAREKRARLPDRSQASTNAVSAVHPRSDVASWVLALVTIAFGLLLLRVGDIALSVSGSAFHGTVAHVLACHVPALVIASGVIAILVTAGQKQPG
jgi:hypothetical protein